MKKSRDLAQRWRILAVVHVFYPELWPEIFRCLSNLGQGADFVVTYSDEKSVIEAKRDLPRANFVQCANRGYDIWPFLSVLQSVDLTTYDCIVKLHTKRDVRKGITLNHARIGGANWRRLLLRFVSSRRNWLKTLRVLQDPSVGMVADRRLIFDRRAATRLHCEEFDLAKSEMEALSGKTFDGGDFVAGTMFAAKPAALQPLLRRRYTEAEFEESVGHGGLTRAHLMERMLGLAASAANLRLESFDGPTVKMRRWWFAHVRIHMPRKR